MPLTAEIQDLGFQSGSLHKANRKPSSWPPPAAHSQGMHWWEASSRRQNRDSNQVLSYGTQVPSYVLTILMATPWAGPAIALGAHCGCRCGLSAVGVGRGEPGGQWGDTWEKQETAEEPLRVTLPLAVRSLRGRAIPEGGRPGPCGVPVIWLEPVSVPPASHPWPQLQGPVHPP